MSWLRAPSRHHVHIPLTDSAGHPGYAEGSPTPQNSTLFQAFEWHTPGSHWTRLASCLPSLSEIGITSIWLPPGCKANSPDGNGYDCYDLWDLGEFDQKWSRSTKWGSREELTGFLNRAKELRVAVVWDAVLNHKTAGDSPEECWAVEVDPWERRQEISPPKKIEPWIHYYFPGRGDTYSTLKWHWQHFNGTDWDQRGQKHALYKIVDPPETYPRPGAPALRRKGWAEDVDDEHGNSDYLMFSNIDYTNEEARRDVTEWGEWMVNDVGLDGFRLDAVQHYSWHFARHWIEAVKAAGRRQGKDIMVFGEFWIGDLQKLVQWTDRMGQGTRTWDVPLCHNLSAASQSKVRWDYDLRKIFRDTLISVRPNNAVTMVMSHDTQKGQATETPITPWFKLLAYALILLRREGLPCVFYGDVYGIQGPFPEPPACGGQLPNLVRARKLYAYGDQVDYFDSRTSIGWTRLGTWDRKDGCAIVISISGSTKKRMYVGTQNSGQVWSDVLGNSKDEVLIDERGIGTFPCSTRSASVFVCETAVGRDGFSSSFSVDIYS